MRKFIEPTKTLVIAVLVFLMLVLWTRNMQLRFSGNISSEQSSPPLDSSFWIFNSSDTHSEITTDTRYFSPLSITLVANRTAYTTATNKPLTDTIRQGVQVLVREVFSSSYICEETSYEAWERVLLSDDFIMISYPSALPYMTLCAFEGKTSEFCTGELCAVKELILYPDENSVVCALGIDGENNVFSFKSTLDAASSMIYDFNSNNLTAYTVNKGFIPAKFSIYENGSSDIKLPAHHVKLLSKTNLEDIKIENAISQLFNSANSGNNITNHTLISNNKVASLLELFNINPTTVGVYTDASLRLVFINSDTRLAISPKGVIEYAASKESDAQILTSDLLKSERAMFSSFEQLSAATEFLNLLNGDFIGKDTELILERIAYSDSKTEYTFAYYNNLCRLNGGDYDEIKLVFDSKGLTEASIVPLTVASDSTGTAQTQSLKADIPEGYALSLSNPSTDTLLQLRDFRPVYVYSEYSMPICPIWAAVTERE